MKSTAVVLATLLASGISAHTYPHDEDNGKLSPRSQLFADLFFKSRGNYTDSTEISNLPLAVLNPVEAATRLIRLKEPYAVFRVQDDSYTSQDTGITHVHFKQTIDGIDVANADYKVNVRRDGRIFSYGGNFQQVPRPARVSPLTTAAEALRGVVDRLTLPINAGGAVAVPQGSDNNVVLQGTSGALTDPSAKLVYYQTTEGRARLSWQIETDVRDEWLISYYDAEGSNELLAVNDYVSDATYNVYKWPINDPTLGARSIERDPYDRKASPFTWEGNGVTVFQSTQGNNGKAQANLNGNFNYDDDPRPMSATRDFNYPYSLNMTDPKSYLEASTTQLWYTSNMFHDILYQLGFTPAAGNFEQNNNGQGGKGNDAVNLNAQDGAGLNNANFATPPDGTPGRMRMYLWNSATPLRDGSFEAGIVIHEYTHGLSNRLTGGPANSNCLARLEARGMGEGWSDFFATAIRVKKSDTRNTDYNIGAWASNRPKGIRLYEYSTSMERNPFTLESVNTMTLVHQIGTVWCSILYEVLWNLIDARGNTDAVKPGFDILGVPTDGRFLAMKLVLDGLALQPCNPGMLDTRDAILDADRALTAGRNVCLLWKGFAKRGMGVDAVSVGDKTFRNGFKVPFPC